MPKIVCSSCRQPYPEQGIPFRCPDCGGVFDFNTPPDYNPALVNEKLPGLWRYQSSFDLPAVAPMVTLGEGRTPLIWQKVDGVEVFLKLESLNPTGSYKDRGTAVLISQLLARGATQAVEDSSGNAGASFAAYAAQAGLPARVFVPESASGPKRAQIKRYGAELIAIPGPRSAAALAVLKEAEAGVPYASHAYLPFGLPGIATIAYEVREELGQVPGSVIAPAGHGGLMLGIVRGFAALRKAGVTDREPYFVVTQAAGCAPMVAAAQNGVGTINNLNEGNTVAEGVRVRQPVRMEALLREVPPEKGIFIAIQEEQILPGFAELARRGVYVEPTSALAWCAFREIAQKLPQPIILILTGSGLKYPLHQ